MQRRWHTAGNEPAARSPRSSMRSLRTDVQAERFGAGLLLAGLRTRVQAKASTAAMSPMRSAVHAAIGNADHVQPAVRRSGQASYPIARMRIVRQCVRSATRQEAHVLLSLVLNAEPESARGQGRPGEARWLRQARRIWVRRREGRGWPLGDAASPRHAAPPRAAVASVRACAPQERSAQRQPHGEPRALGDQGSQQEGPIRSALAGRSRRAAETTGSCRARGRHRSGLQARLSSVGAAPSGAD